MPGTGHVILCRGVAGSQSTCEGHTREPAHDTKQMGAGLWSTEEEEEEDEETEMALAFMWGTWDGCSEEGPLVSKEEQKTFIHSTNIY